MVDFPAPIRKKYNIITSSLRNLISNNLKEIQSLEMLRETILPKLLTGELNLSNIEIGGND